MTEFDPVAFLEDAVRIPSHEDVTEMREFLVETLRAHGEEPWVDAAGNVRASKGSGGPHLVLNTHIDTVPPHVPYDREDERIRGRGSCDAKGPLAGLLAAFLAAEPGEGSGTLTLAVTPDEEVLSTGAHALLHGEVLPGGPGETGATVPTLAEEGPEPDLFVVGEPTGLDVCTAARGRFEATVRLSGSAAHAASPEEGANAVRAAGDALRALDDFDNVDPHPDLGAATLVPTTIDGGEATNQVPADCAFVVDRRSVPPETAEGYREALEAHLREAVAAGPASDVALAVELADRETPFLEAFATDRDHRLVQTLAARASIAAADHDRGGGAVRNFGAATEASYFSPAPTVVFGPGSLADDEGAVAHAEREYVPTAEVRAAADALTVAVADLLG